MRNSPSSHRTTCRTAITTCTPSRDRGGSRVGWTPSAFQICSTCDMMVGHSIQFVEPVPAGSDIPAQGRVASASLSLSVLVPVYNERYLVEASLRRLLALRDDIIHRMEVTVVADCNTVALLDVAELPA